MLTLLAATSIVGIIASSWVLVWLCLEINTLCICWLLSNEANEINNNDNSTIMYYLVQVLASILILITTLINSGPLSETMATIFILINIGVWPAHAWYINLISSIDINISSFVIVITWQNILPTILVFLIGPSNTPTLLILGVSLFSLITPLTNISENININSIIALSSLNNNSWLIFSFASSIYSFIVFLSLYSSALLSTLNTINNITNNNNTISLSFWSATLIISNISGLPPFTIFWANLVAINAFINSNIPSEMIFIVIASACYILYHYLWVALSEITNNSTNSISNINEENKEKTIIIISAASTAGLYAFIS